MLHFYLFLFDHPPAELRRVVVSAEFNVSIWAEHVDRIAYFDLDQGMQIEWILITMIVVLLNRGNVNAIFAQVQVPCLFGDAEHDGDVVHAGHFDCRHTSCWLNFEFLEVI